MGPIKAEENEGVDFVWAWCGFGALFGFFWQNRWRFLVYYYGLLIYQGNPSISLKRTPMGRGL